MQNLIASFLKSDLSSSPWTIYIDQEFIEGKKHNIPSICQNCASRECLAEGAGEFCEFGMKSFRAHLGPCKVVVPGVLGSKDTKKQKKSKFSSAHFQKWLSTLDDLQSEILNFEQAVKSDTLHHIHDPVKWADQIKISSENIIESQGGAGFNEKFSNASKEIKAIYQSSKLLSDSFKMIGIFFNPESITFGRPRKINVYRLFDKVQAIIFNAEGKKYNKRFHLSGDSFKEVYVYESFQIIALTLVQNALKYSKAGQIDIIIDDAINTIDVEVVSRGPLISSPEKDRIFEKGYRGGVAKQMHHDGAGMGLYVAQKVAVSHKCKIYVDSTPLEYQNDGIQMAENKFYFKVPLDGS